MDYANEIASALKSYGNYKLGALYHSICDIELEHHTPLICIGNKELWRGARSLTVAVSGR